MDAINLAEGLGAEARLLPIAGTQHCPNVIIPGSPDYEFDQVMGFLVASLKLCVEMMVFP